jgi:hypothetical protein
VSLILVLVTALPVASQQKTPSTSPASLSPTEAFEILNALNEKEKLLPASFMFATGRKLSAENCFGIVTPQGLRLAGESTGEVGLSGSITSPQGQKRVMVFIGILYSEFPFILQAKTFPSGPYMLMAFRDAIELSGDDKSGTHYDYNRDRQCPIL